MKESSESRRLLLIIAYTGFISLGLPDTVSGIAWPSVRETFRLHQSGYGLILIGAGCGYFISSFFTGRLMKMLGIGVLLAASSGLVALSGFGFSLAPFWAAFVACSVLHGLGSGAIDAGLNHYVAHHFSARHMNWLHACYSLGATFGPLIMTAALTWSGVWRVGYATVGSILLLLSLLFLATRHYWGGRDEATDEHGAEASASMSETLSNRIVWLQVALFFVYTGMEVTVGQWSFTVLTESRGIDKEVAGLWVTAYWASIGVGRVLFGFVVERVGIDRLLRFSTITAVVGTALFAWRGSGVLTFVGLVLVGLALAPIYPCMMTRTPQRLGKALSAHAIGFQVSAAMIGAAALPGISGLLAQRYGLEQVAVAAVGMAVALWGLHESLLWRPVVQEPRLTEVDRSST
ncbi:MFS transporter [Verrucomicrobiota bacterium sgz303538]